MRDDLGGEWDEEPFGGASRASTACRHDNTVITLVAGNRSLNRSAMPFPTAKLTRSLSVAGLFELMTKTF